MSGGGGVRSREPGAAQAVAPDLALVKDEMDPEEYDMPQHGQEPAPLPDLSAVKDDIDIEEHDLLQHPRVRAAIESRRARGRGAAPPDEDSEDVWAPWESHILSEAAEGLLRAARDHNLLGSSSTADTDPEVMPPSVSSLVTSTIADENVIVEGIRIKVEEDAILDQSWKLFSSKVVLRDCWAEVQQSGREYKTAQKSHLKLHMRTHTGEKQFKCDQYSEDVWAPWEDHVLSGAAEGLPRADRDHNLLGSSSAADTDPEVIQPSVSSLVTSTIADENFVVEGIRIKTDEDAILDPSWKLFSSKVPLRDCAAELQQSGRYCQQCRVQFSSCSALAEHNASTHFSESLTEAKKLECDQCEFKTAYKSNLNRHIRTHTGDKPFKCDQCEFRTTYTSNLKTHMINHTGEKPFSCDHCNYKSAFKANIKLHMNTHTAEKAFKCDQCEYRCARSSNFKRHVIRNHTGQKSFKCDQCYYRTARRSFLKKHMRTHTGEKPYKCDQCNYRAAQRFGLKQHIRSHTGEKPFKCDLCEFRTAQSSNLLRHVKTHGINWYETIPMSRMQARLSS